MTSTTQDHRNHADAADPGVVVGPDDDANLAEALSAARRRAEHLEIALQSSRVIGMAIGIAIERCRLSSDEAFHLLATISQRDNRKLRDVASDLVFTGVIPPGTA